ncbi:MAG: MerR family transcriptional regulator [Deltaproteobacteria bacterium]|jgi:DNA-binding transcriptional MerR regulator|nr:MerR family transcriptional regulator [Deltaproteobacteria bacterium]
MHTTKNTHSIGALAKLAKCQPMTIRFYEKKGLMDRPKRLDNGYRYYTNQDSERLFFIRHCRDHGFSIDEIKSLLELEKAPEANCGMVDNILEFHLKKLDNQLKSLNYLRQKLILLRKKCPNSGSVDSCGILKSLRERNLCPCTDSESESLQLPEDLPSKKVPK